MKLNRNLSGREVAPEICSTFIRNWEKKKRMLTRNFAGKVCRFHLAFRHVIVEWEATCLASTALVGPSIHMLEP